MKKHTRIPTTSGHANRDLSVSTNARRSSLLQGKPTVQRAALQLERRLPSPAVTALPTGTVLCLGRCRAAYNTGKRNASRIGQLGSTCIASFAAFRISYVATYHPARNRDILTRTLELLWWRRVAVAKWTWVQLTNMWVVRVGTDILPNWWTKEKNTHDAVSSECWANITTQFG